MMSHMYALATPTSPPQGNGEKEETGERWGRGGDKEEEKENTKRIGGGEWRARRGRGENEEKRMRGSQGK